MSLSVLGRDPNFHNFPEEDKHDVLNILTSIQLAMNKDAGSRDEFFALTAKQVRAHILQNLNITDKDQPFFRIWEKCHYEDSALLEFLQNILEQLVREGKIQRRFMLSDSGPLACYSNDYSICEHLGRNIRQN